jgi:enamine deaminase RidA (YjgF/YER057c/UK114 family)
MFDVPAVPADLVTAMRRRERCTRAARGRSIQSDEKVVMMPKEVINPEGLWDSGNRSYSHVVKVTKPESLIFVAGVGAVNPQFEVVSDDIRDQTHRCFEIIKAELEAAGASLDDICDMTVYLTDIENHKWPVREVRAEYFDAGREPVSTMIGVSRFAIEGMLIEIDVIAAT